MIITTPPHCIIHVHNQRVECFIKALAGQGGFPDLVTEPAAEQRCHLGLWLRGEGYRRYANNPMLYEDLLGRHDSLHRLAREAKACRDLGDAQGVLQKISDLGRVNRSLMALLQQTLP